MPFPKINLHIHSNYSDGKQSINHIVEKAIKLDLNYIAITDHFTNSWKAWVSTLNNYETISKYLEEISSYQRYLINNDKHLTLLKGIEVDLASSEQFIKDFIQLDKYDLVLFEYLQSYDTVAFLKNIINYWKKKITKLSDLPILGLAHFDPSYFVHGNLDTLMNFLKEYNIYFEFNSSYPSYYSPRYTSFFEKLEEYKIPVAIGCDSHRRSNLNDIEEPFEMIKYYNLEKNLEILLKTLKSKKLS
ncbi:MAG: PHP domain-containing protein [Candidatus Lokiarchaeota archaeon]|nr:PHP domain-containing protein [Candidatus Lokiarchaeota archaeon]